MAQPSESIKNMMLGIGALEDSLARVAINRTLADAQSKVNDINASVVEEREKQVALSQLGQQLSLQMAQQGASASMINETAGGLGPGAGAMFQAGENRALQQERQNFQMGESAKDRQLQRDLASMKISAPDTKKADKLMNAKNWFIKNRASSESKALELIQGAESAYEEVGSTATTQGMYVRAILKAAGEDRLNEGDLGTIPYQSSKLRQIAQQAGIELTGEHPEAVTKFYRQIALALGKEKKQQMLNKVKGFAKSRAETMGIAEEELSTGLAIELGLDDQAEDTLGEFSKLPPAVLRSQQQRIAEALKRPNDPKAKAYLQKLRSKALKGS